MDMWAHYAEGHKGVCLKYDIEEHMLPECVLSPVIYQNDLTRQNLLKPTEDIVTILTTK